MIQNRLFQKTVVLGLGEVQDSLGIAWDSLGLEGHDSQPRGPVRQTSPEPGAGLWGVRLLTLTLIGPVGCASFDPNPWTRWWSYVHFGSYVRFGSPHTRCPHADTAHAPHLLCTAHAPHLLFTCRMQPCANLRLCTSRSLALVLGGSWGLVYRGCGVDGRCWCWEC